MKLVVVIALAAIVTHHSGGPSRFAAPREVEIIGLDYAFRAPAEIRSGPTTFRFRNAGKARHELVIVRLKQGATIDQLVQRMKDSLPIADVVDGNVGVLFADTGKRSTAGLTTTLTGGREYVIYCQFRDTLTAPRHFQMGMYSLLKVKPSPSIATLERIKVDTIVAHDYAFVYPRTLAPGPHVFVFRNDGKVLHEFNIALLKRGVTLQQFLERRRTNAPTRDLVDEGLGVLLSQSRSESLGRLTVNLLSGREYRIICIFRDDPKAPPHFQLGMYGSIQVTGNPGG
ncbi:MAG TPA: hypothetical protein VM099_15125 [Gemmatimonadaceae bacterium]|nr:hypothetical protein [Gemmatimonadaceae bacterium]